SLMNPGRDDGRYQRLVPVEGLSALPALMLLYNNVAELRQIRGLKRPARLIAAAVDLNIEVADFLAQGVAVDAEQVGRANLVAAGGGERGGQQRIFDLAQDAVIEPGRRHPVLETGEIARQVALDRGAEGFFGAQLLATGRQRRLRQFGVDHRGGDRFLRIERRQPARQIFEFAHVARPAVPFQALLPGRIDVLGGQAFALRLREEMADEVGNVLAALAQRRQPQRHDVQAEEQVFAEQALLDQQPQVLVRGGDDAHVALDRRAAADGSVFALLQYAQQPRLRFHRHVADLVEKQRAALGLLEAAGGARIGAGDGALLVSEQF